MKNVWQIVLKKINDLRDHEVCVASGNRHVFFSITSIAKFFSLSKTWNRDSTTSEVRSTSGSVIIRKHETPFSQKKNVVQSGALK